MRLPTPRSLLLYLCLLGSWPLYAHDTQAQSPDPAAILRSLDAGDTGAIPFTERRFNTLLVHPLLLQGHVRVQPDGTLERVVEEPYRERAIIGRDFATLERDGEVRRVDLHGRHRSLLYLRSLSAIVRADLDELEQTFSLETSGNPQAWQLTLVPRDESLRDEYRSIVVSGGTTGIDSIRTEQSRGAWQEIRFHRPHR